MISVTERKLIHQIAQRASMLYLAFGIKVDPAYIASELMFVHEKIVALRLAELLATDDGNFSHDIGGIHRYLDMSGERLRDCFLPRFAAV